eukprot:SM000010S04372  [mRNA]  locus=s10:1231069:1233233:+ [translate_table: standard]
MERVAAKEGLLLAIQDAGGVEALAAGRGTDAGRLVVAEKILALERLNPTPRPTTSPLLEGLWDFQWAGATSPGVRAARILLQRFPSPLAKIDSLTLEILGGGTKATAALKFFDSVEATFTLTTRLTVEGPLKLKEEYVEGLLSSPNVRQADIPAGLKGLYDQLYSAAQQLPPSVRESLSRGVRLPLNNFFSRGVLVSYLDDEILVARDQYGVPDVLRRSLIPAIDRIEDEFIPYSVVEAQL